MGRKNRRKMRPADDVLRDLAAEIIAGDKKSSREPPIKRDRLARFDRTFGTVISMLFLLDLVFTIVVFVKGVTP